LARHSTTLGPKSRVQGEMGKGFLTLCLLLQMASGNHVHLGLFPTQETHPVSSEAVDGGVLAGLESLIQRGL
jgi:hypothetical protein